MSSGDRVREMQKAEALRCVTYGIMEDGDEFALLDQVADESSLSIAEETHKERIAELTHQALEVCTAKQQAIIIRYFGLDGEPPENDREIAARRGTSRNAVWISKQAGLRRIKNFMIENAIDLETM